MGSTCSMTNNNDPMASTTTLQSYIPPLLETLDEDEVEGEETSLTR